jgi:hypothetical protein
VEWLFILEIDLKTKICVICKLEKELSEYYLTTKRGKPYVLPRCKACSKLINNLEETKLRKSQWHQKNKERLYNIVVENKKRDPESYKNKRRAERAKVKSDTEKYEKSLAYSRSWRASHKDSRRKTWVKYREKNAETIRAKSKEYAKERAKFDINYRMRIALNSQMRYALRNGGCKSDRTLVLLGCSVKHLKIHLELKFQPGMTWENYGIEGWHIDHVHPCSAFDLTKPDQQRLCFNYTNLQPMWAYENRSKGGKILCPKPDFALEFCEPKKG